MALGSRQRSLRLSADLLWLLTVAIHSSVSLRTARNGINNPTQQSIYSTMRNVELRTNYAINRIGSGEKKNNKRKKRERGATEEWTGGAECNCAAALHIDHYGLSFPGGILYILRLADGVR